METRLFITVVFLVAVSVCICEEYCDTQFSCPTCTSINVCVPDYRSDQLIKFATINCTGSTPFCDDLLGVCVESPTEECMEKNEYVCFKDGVYPAPRNCGKYYECQDRHSNTKECPTGNVYDAVSQTCVNESKCHLFDCKTYSGRKVVHPTDRKLFTYCIAGKATYTNSCEDGQELNEETQTCQPICSHIGLLPDFSDCSSYYYCFPVEKDKFVVSHMKCFGEKVFDRARLQCVRPPPGYSCTKSTRRKYNFRPHIIQTHKPESIKTKIIEQ